MTDDYNDYDNKDGGNDGKTQAILQKTMKTD